MTLLGSAWGFETTKLLVTVRFSSAGESLLASAIFYFTALLLDFSHLLIS